MRDLIDIRSISNFDFDKSHDNKQASNGLSLVILQIVLIILRSEHLDLTQPGIL